MCISNAAFSVSGTWLPEDATTRDQCDKRKMVASWNGAPYQNNGPKSVDSDSLKMVYTGALYCQCQTTHTVTSTKIETQAESRLLCFSMSKYIFKTKLIRAKQSADKAFVGLCVNFCSPRKRLKEMTFNWVIMLMRRGVVKCLSGVRWRERTNGWALSNWPPFFAAADGRPVWARCMHSISLTGSADCCSRQQNRASHYRLINLC